MDGELLKHVEKDPECWEPSPNRVPNGKCNVDPSKIILVNVKRSFHGNYSCSGRNRAGWGIPSPSKELVVHYQPTEAKIKAVPDIVLKGQPFQVRKLIFLVLFVRKAVNWGKQLNKITCMLLLQIKCASENLGFPKANKVRWLHNGVELGGETSFNLKVLKSAVTSQGNYTCSPYNSAGFAKPDWTQVKLKAPPTFVQRLPYQKGENYN